MGSIQNNSDTVIIVLHEIYGVNQHVKLTCGRFNMNGYDIICPNLINTNEVFDYSQEKMAYQHFIDTMGFEFASQETKRLMIEARKKYKYVFLVGYSIGATIAWICSNEKNLADGVVGYYGSRIRDYIDITPKCPALLFFPTKEGTFDVGELANSLNKMNVDAHILKGEHGFCDPFNKAYYEQSCKNAEQLTDKFISEIRKRNQDEI